MKDSIKKIRICSVNRLGLGIVSKGGGYGGGEVQGTIMAEELSMDKDLDVHIIVEGNCPDRFKYKNTTVWVKPKTNIIRDIFQTYKLFRKINADFYIERTANRAHRIYSPLICKLLGKKYVYIEACDPDRVRERSIITRLAYSTGLALTDIIIASAKHMTGKMRKFTKKAIYEIYPPILFPKQAHKARKNIIWVGRVPDRYKRPELFLKLAERFPKEKFLMIILGKLTMPTPPNVEVIYDVPTNKIDEYYASAKMLIHTSWSEGFGNVYLEAWKNKTPVVSLTVDPDDVIKKYKTGFHSGNFEQMAKDVQTLLTNKKTWKEYSKNGYKYVVQNHNARRTAEQCKELFLKHK